MNQSDCILLATGFGAGIALMYCQSQGMTPHRIATECRARSANLLRGVTAASARRTTTGAPFSAATADADKKTAGVSEGEKAMSEQTRHVPNGSKATSDKVRQARMELQPQLLMETTYKNTIGGRGMVPGRTFDSMTPKPKKVDPGNCMGMFNMPEALGDAMESQSTE